jgi:hypothetical protein
MANSAQNNFISGEKTVAATGTAEALLTDSGGSSLYNALIVIAKNANTGQVFLGGTDVSSATNDGLDAGESVEFSSRHGFRLASIFIDVEVNAEGVDFYAVR